MKIVFFAATDDGKEITEKKALGIEIDLADYAADLVKRKNLMAEFGDACDQFGTESAEAAAIIKAQQEYQREFDAKWKAKEVEDVIISIGWVIRRQIEADLATSRGAVLHPRWSRQPNPKREPLAYFGAGMSKEERAAEISRRAATE